MKSSHTLMLACVALLATMSSHAQDTERARDWESLREVDRAFAERSRTLGMNQAFVDTLGEGAVVFRRGPVDAFTIYQRLNPDERSTATLDSRAHYIDVSLAGDLGLTSGPYRYTIGTGEELQRTHGHFVNIWRKFDNEWRLVADIVVRVPGVLSLDVEPDIGETARAMAESPPLAVTSLNTLEGLLAAEERFVSSINYRGGRRAVLRYGIDNQRIYVPGMAPGIGSEAGSTVYGAFLDDHIATSQLTYQSAGGYMALSGDLGYTFGTMSADGSSFNTSYLRLWRFTTEGEWKIAVEVLSPF